MIQIFEDSHLWIEGLSTKWVDGLSRMASFPNEQKKLAKKEMIYGADAMHDLLTLAEYDNGYLYLPRGLKTDLIDILDESGHEYEIFDQTVCGKPFGILEVPDCPKLTEEQRPAVKAILEKQSGRIIMPTGSGKTVVALSAVANIKRPTIILVDKLHIAQQWRERAWEHIGFTPGIIGDNQWDERPITVAVLQTLHSRKDEIERSWYEKWSILIHDEQHHIPAESYQGVVQRFPAKYRLAFSATVGKSPAKKKISELVYGPIIFESKEQKIKPEIQIIETDFDFPYEPTQKIDAVSKKTGRKYKKVKRNNYADLIKELIADRDRNSLIASRIYKDKNCASLIVSRRRQHLYDIRDMVLEMGFPEERCWLLTGKEKSDERMEIYKLADAGECAIFSTVADEALDIPRLDRLHMAFPQKNEENVKQHLGRIVREHPDKDTAVAYDYVDNSIGIIKNQFGHRLRQLYQRQQLTVFKISD
jgi:superfamily II DNA or RNA helicase